MKDWPALGCVALCAFHPFFLPFGVLLLSDAPFLAVALTAAMLADSALRKNGRLAMAIAAGLFAGISAELRTVGLAVIAGIFFAGVIRRAWKQTAVTALAAAPFLALALWPLIAAIRAHAGTQTALAEPGWTQTLAYTTSYLRFWRMCVPDAPFFFAMLWQNLVTFLIEPGILITLPVQSHSTVVSAIVLILSGAIFLGITRQARKGEWKPLHFIFAFNAAMILPWNYPLMGRFLLLFLPLFYAGLWVEGKRFFGTLGKSVRSGHAGAERILAAAMGLGIIGLGAIAARNYFDGVREQLTLIRQSRGVMLGEKKEAYDWIRRNTRAEDSIVAYEDAALYLYTGRQSVRPIAFSTESMYREDGVSVKRDLEHITDAARHIRARYWVMAADDYQQENLKPAGLLDERIAELKSVLPVVFRGQEGRVEIRELTCLNEPQRPECGAAAAVLFPARGASNH